MFGSAAVERYEPSEALRAPYATIVVVGGGCYGTYYVRQLLRARDAAALSFDRLLVVDRNENCQATSLARGEPSITIVCKEWELFFDDYLSPASGERTLDRDAIVPSPLMPHLMFDWIVRRAVARWPRRTVERRPLPRAPNLPWQRGTASGTHVVSFAEWVCPVNCVEPAMCPVIKGPRTWSMPAAVRAYVQALRRGATPLAGPVIFHCEHRAYGVGMFDTRAVLEGDALIARVAEHAGANVLVGTVSHCHGALDLLHIASGHGN